MTTILKLVLAAFCVVLAPAANAQVMDWQDMRDWSVMCRDNRYCIAFTSGESKDGDKLSLKLERSNKERSKVFVTVNPKEQPLTLGDTVAVSVVGHEYTLQGEVDKVYKGNEMAFAVETRSETIAKLREGRFGQVDVTFQKSGRTIRYDLSLQGVASVLAAMDVVQGRMDREDAAIIHGGEAAFVGSGYDLAAAKAPPATADDEKENAGVDPEENIEYPPDDEPTAENAAQPGNAEPNEESGIGVVDLVYDPKQLPDRVLMPGYRMLNCDLATTVPGFGAQVINLAPAMFLYIVPCSNADMNVPYYVALEDAGEIDTLEFQEPASATGNRVSLITNAQWNPSAGTLTSYQYYSPNQDCGRHEVHGFFEQEKTFYLSEYRLKDSCDGKVSSPADYPIEWNGEGD
ncbi:MAG: DUF1176 domain-containing protein [Pseudomonadota bacterium]